MKNLKKVNISLMDWLYMIAGSFVCAASIYYLMMPAKLVVGGVAGLAVVVDAFIPIGVSSITMILNIGLLLVGYLLIGPEFGVKTVITSFMIPVFMGILEWTTPSVPALTDDIIINAVSYLLMVTIGQAILFNRNASSGGLDIIGKIINKYLHLDLGTSMILAGMAAAASGALIYDRKSVVVGLLATFFSGLILDYFLAGFNVRKKVCILSKEHKAIQKFIMEDIARGTTVYHAYGGYDGRQQEEINVILEPSEYSRLLEKVSELDPEAFITAYTVGELHGRFEDKKRFENKSRLDRTVD